MRGYLRAKIQKLRPRGATKVNAKILDLDILEAQHKDISKRLKEAKKTRDARHRITGGAILGFIEEQPDSGMTKTLVDLLNRRVTKAEDREALMKKVKTASAAPA